MGKFDGILICTDLDGTLYKNDKTISDENLEAIEYFKSQGGLFTFVTGRMPYYAGDAAGKIKPNAPFGCVNGGGLYDYVNDRYLWTSTMPDGVLELVKCIDEAFDNVGIQVCAFDKTYFCNENISTKRFRALTGLAYIPRHYDDIKEPIAKILFCDESDDEIREIARLLNSHPLAEKFDFIRSERTLYEILPKGISKGTSIKKLSELLGIDIRKTVALGDYNNDIPMFEAAGIGIAVSNACADALSAADFVTVSNEEHAIAQVVRDIESGKYKL